MCFFSLLSKFLVTGVRNVFIATGPFVVAFCEHLRPSLSVSPNIRSFSVFYRHLRFDRHSHSRFGVFAVGLHSQWSSAWFSTGSGLEHDTSRGVFIVQTSVTGLVARGTRVQFSGPCGLNPLLPPRLV